MTSGKPVDLDNPSSAAWKGTFAISFAETLQRSGARRIGERDRRQQHRTLLQRVPVLRCRRSTGIISELQSLRDVLHEEGARVSARSPKYAHLSQSAMQSTKIIAESLAHWKEARRPAQHPKHDRGPQTTA